MVNYSKNKLFILINILGHNKNIKILNNNTYINKLSFIKIYNTVLVLRIKDLFILLKSKKFNIFFFNYITGFHLGWKNSFTNNLKNNFKFFIYSLYNSNILLYKISKTLNNKDSLQTLNYLLKSNLYYPYSLNSDSNLSNSFYYNFLYIDSFKSHTFSFINKFYNYSYLRSNKKKRFKQKESEKLSLLRANLNLVKKSPFKLKFYYRYFEYKRLHSYWNKEAFLAKKFKYFNPQYTNNTFLLHFFYKFRKFKNFSKKYDLFRKNFFINFWLQAKIKKFKFISHKIKNKAKKASFKFNKFYFNSLLLQDKVSSSLSVKYKKYFFGQKFNNFSFLLKFFSLSKNSFYKKTIKNYIKFLNSYNNFKNLKLKYNLHLLQQNKNNFRKTGFLKKKKNLNLQLVNFNINKSTRYFLFNSFKKNKFFRIKFKYIRWLNHQKNFKKWKFNKYLSYKGVSFKNFKNNINLINSLSFNFYNYSKNKILNNFIYKARFDTYNWLKYSLYFKNLHKKNNLYLILENFKKASNNYFQNFSFYKSNKILDQKYTYLNLFKTNKLNSGIFKNKSKNNFILQKLSKNSFKKSWLIIYKKFPKSKKYKGFYNLVPIYNFFFINKVMVLYKKLFISKIVPFYSPLFNISLNKKSFNKKSFAPFRDDFIKFNLLNRVNNIRSIDKKYSFKKRKESQLLYSLKNYKNIQSLLLYRFKKINESAKYKSSFIKQKQKTTLLIIKKIIKKIKYSLNVLGNTTLKQELLLYNNFKLNFFKKTSFLNFLKYYNNIKLKNNKLLYFLNNNYYSFKNTPSLLIYNTSFKNKNLNKVRNKLFKNKKLFSLLMKKKKINNSFFILDNLFLCKIKKINMIKYNLQLNFLLKKKYSIFLKLFKFFSLYKRFNLRTINILGFGKLSNYLNINNENIFSRFNFYVYNFSNFSLENFFLKERNNYFSSYQKSNTTTTNDFNSLDYNYDILKKNSIISKIIYSKNFIIKYLSLLHINKLFTYKTKKLYSKFYSVNSKTLYTNVYLNNNLYYYSSMNVSLKKIYYNIMINFNNMLSL